MIIKTLITRSSKQLNAVPHQPIICYENNRNNTLQLKLLDMFQINIKNIIINPVKDLDDIYISEAIETVYNNSGCVAELNWNGYIIPILGTYIGGLYHSIIHMIKQINLGNKYFIENFLENEFTAKWECYTEEDNLTITAYFIDIACDDIEGTLRSSLNKCNIISIEKDCFIYEWNKLLNRIKKDLISVGYNKISENR